MQGPVVQTIALVLAANARKRQLSVNPFWPDASYFQFCKKVHFVDPNSAGFFRRAAKTVANDPNDWLERAERIFQGARVHVVARNDPNISDRDSVGFVGGGSRWIVELVGNERSELWEDTWRLSEKDAADRRIWNVDYLRLDCQWRGEPEAARSLAEISTDLKDAVTQTIDFARANAPSWVEFYERALKSIDEPGTASSPYHDDLIPAGLLDPDAQHLLISTQVAWAFGGMGSWNDMWFEGDTGERFNALSDWLFSTLIEATAVAVNSSFPDKR